MEEKRKNSFPINWPSVALLLALAGNLLWLQSPLHSSRPAETARDDGVRLGEQLADARLWQDPFEAVSRFLKANKSESDRLPPYANLDAQIKRRWKPEQPNLVLLPVMVTGSQYAEGGEWRVRSRFAVLSGLERAGYVPEDCDHIGFCKIAWPDGASLGSNQPPAAIPLPQAETNAPVTLTVPFEWLVRYDSSKPDSAKSYVLLLWLHEELFADLPLTRLALLIQKWRPAAEAPNPLAPVKIIGPWGSTTLREMFREDTTRQIAGPGLTNSVSNILNHVTVYSASATAADWRLVGTSTRPHTKAPRTEIASNFREKTAGLRFVNATCTDDQLAGQLVEELRRRGVDLSETGHRVALISEWDTFYGRALPQSFTNAVAQLTNNRPANATESVWSFTYLRGLDGRLAGRENAADSPGPKDSGKTLPLEQLERPEGNSQLDYIPRLAAALKAREQESIRRSKQSVLRLHVNGKLDAIGLLGSDVYDKLLLLQSLRQRFPDVIFFTTDLDARLAHVSQMPWSRNLIVASSFGLALHPDFQGAVPPFRDSYQTAAFLAVQAALGTFTAELTNALSPRLFEIGRYGPYDLSVATNAAKLQPPRPNQFAGASSLTLLVLGVMTRWLPPVCLGLVLLGLMSWQTRRRVEVLLKSRRVLRALLVTLGLLLIYVAWVLREHLSLEGEPFSLLAGISIWPTEFIRLAATLLGLALVFKAMRDLQKDTNDLVQEFGLEPPGRFQDEKRERIGIADFSLEDPTKTEAQDGEAIWKQYNLFGQPASRWRRCGAVMLAYFVFALALFLALGVPFIPGRGPASFILDKVAVMATVVVLIVVTFYVMDATRLCTRLIELLSQHGATWPTEKTEQFQKSDKLWKLANEEQNEWTTIRFIARRTAAIGWMIYYPFLVLLLLIISRNYFFDAWHWPASLIIIQGFNVSFALFSAVHLRRTAERARQRGLARLNERLSRELGSLPDGKTSSNRAEQIRLVMRLIENNEDGAFAPLANHPIIGALAMPFGGASLMAALEFFATH